MSGERATRAMRWCSCRAAASSRSYEARGPLGGGDVRGVVRGVSTGVSTGLSGGNSVAEGSFFARQEVAKVTTPGFGQARL